MSTILLNLDFGGSPPKKALEGNAKHRKFVKKRRLLEQKGFLNKKKQTPSKLHSEPPKKGENVRVDGTWKIPPLSRKKTPAPSTGSGLSLDKKTAVPWLTPAPSKKVNSVAAKVDLLGEFQSALPKIKNHPTRSQKKAPQKKNPPQNNATQNSTRNHLENKCSGASQKLPGKMVAIDCEMVGTGPKGHVSSLARCSIVNYDGDVLYDEYILPPCHIVDYRTKWSGICKKHMVNATPFKIARSQILKIILGKIVVGHAIHNDFKALQYFHPKSLTRDTSQIPLLNRKANCPENATMSLKRLTKQLLHRDIQIGKGGHSSVEDAQATMELYKLVEVEWEQHLAQNPPKN